MPESVEPDIEPENIPLDILYEDVDLIVVNKPKGMVVHPAAGHYSGTLVNALMYHCGRDLSGINGVLRPGIVHRIDKDTTGSVIACKNDKAHRCIAEQLKEHSINRRYRAICFGELNQEEGTIDQPIGRHPNDRKKMAVNHQNGKRAVTHYRVLQRFQGYTYIECVLETGRTHQIHCVGDVTIGENSGQCGGQKQQGLIVIGREPNTVCILAANPPLGTVEIIHGCKIGDNTIIRMGSHPDERLQAYKHW